ncbi:MAG: xanthine dehydrogenase family protein subunit M [Defluviicoccus sp.]|nr:xanthine dehydrogenase family protein subunit M [Defluviicoccus sp.]MDE0274831.1 xanthine dehydrogenase family protein subunit M [Defluviicoccus sp.]
MASYLRPRNLESALAAMADAPRTVVAGGTDYYPARVGRPLDDDVLDVTGIESLREIEDLGDRYRIGALVTWTQTIETPLPPMFDGLKRAAREVGGVQVQNSGTVVGNVCNASPAADGVPNLLALDAEIELASCDATRSVPIGKFITGNRETVRAKDEVVTAISIPKPAEGTTSSFLKLGARHYLVISIVMTAGVLEPAPGGTVASMRLAVGSCSAVAQRLYALEEALRGRPVDARLQEAVTEDHLAALSPIDDVRGSGEYRMDAALTLVRRTLAELGSA